jgi:exopolysaccharide biosynthesis polyprenyl glycosylphosphotransferase
MSHATLQVQYPLTFMQRNIVLLPLDMIMLGLAWHLTIELRVLMNGFMTLQFVRAELKLLAPSLGAVLVLWVAAAHWLGVYRPDRRRLPASDSTGVLKSVIMADAIVIVVTFFSREFGVASLSRSFVLLFLPVSFLTVRAGRYSALLASSIGKEKLHRPERVAVLGLGPSVRYTIQSIRQRSNSMFSIVGVIVPVGASSRGLGNPVPVLGTTAQLGEVINREGIDRILLVENLTIPKYELDSCTTVAKRMGVTISRDVSAMDRDARLEFGTLGDLRVLELKPIFFTRRQELVKRVFDVVTSLVVLILLSPLLVCLAVLIKLTSKGPMLYKSVRVGRGGRHFNFLKFRSMYAGGPSREDLKDLNEKGGHLFKIRNDPRITPLGRLMRRFSLDELPQLLNVLWGDMSLAGPRPLPAQDLDPDGQSRRFKAWAEQRSRVLPGITGLWQISGRSDVSFEKMMELDVSYIRNWSLAVDLYILLTTPRAVLSGRGAY